MSASNDEGPEKLLASDGTTIAVWREGKLHDPVEFLGATAEH